MHKDKLESMCRAAGMAPEQKETCPDGEIYVADGFSATPHETFRSFGVSPGEFPFGAFGTMWWIADGEGHIKIGQPLIFDALHDKEKGWNQADKKRARINAAMKAAHEVLEKSHAG